MNTLDREIMQRAYALDPTGLDTVLGSLSLPGWPQTVQGLSFQGRDTGGGCMMLVAELPNTGGHQVGITDGDVNFPQDTETFCLGIADLNGDEIYTMFVEGGELQS